MTRNSWLLTLGAVLVCVGLLVPPSVIIGVLDTEAVGERLEQLRVGVWLFKMLLCGHGGWLLFSGLRSRVRDGRREDPEIRSRSLAPLWQPVVEGNDWSEARTGSMLLVILLVIGAGIRWIGIGQDLWHDEVFTLIDFVRPALGRILSDYSSDNQHLLYSILAHLSVTLFGESAVSLRLPAFLLGLASLWATLRLGSLTVGRRQAVLATALLTVSYHHVWFSQNARGYTGLLLMTALSTELFLRGLWSRRWAVWVGYASAVAIGMALHPTMIFVSAAHAFALLGLAVGSETRARDFQQPLGSLLLSGTLTLQIYAFVLPQMLELYLQPAAGAGTAEFRWKSPLWLINETIRGLDIGLGFGWLGLVGGGLLVALGLYGLLARSRLTTVCFVAPAFLGGVTMVLLGRNLWPRFFFNSGTFATLIAVQGAWVLGTLITRRLRRSGDGLSLAMACLMVLASMVTLPRVFRYPKQDFTGAKDYVEQQQQAGDRIVALDLAGDVYRHLYGPELFVASTLGELESQRSGDGDTWILYTLPEHIAATEPALWETVQADYEFVRAFPGTLSGGTIVVRRRGVDRAGAPGSVAAGSAATGVADELSNTPEEIDEQQ